MLFQIKSILIRDGHSSYSMLESENSDTLISPYLYTTMTSEKPVLQDKNTVYFKKRLPSSSFFHQLAIKIQVTINS